MSICIPERGDLLIEIITHVQSYPLKRPRASKAAKFVNIYQPLTNQKELREAFAQYEPMLIDHPIIMDCFLQQKKAKTSKMKYPCGRTHGDDDNLRKAVSDGLQAANIIQDDARIIGGATYKVFGTEPVTIVKIYGVSNDTWEVDYDL